MRDKSEPTIKWIIATLCALLSALADSQLSGEETSGISRTSPRLPPIPFDYAAPVFPEHVQKHVAVIDAQNGEGRVTNHGATLGRVLFYDKRLSINGTISCGSCHIQEYGFADPRRVSRGFDDQCGTRNSMSLVNLRFNPSSRFFWDERAESLEDQVVMPIVDPIEMGHSLSAITSDLAEAPIYQTLFVNAFGDSSVTKSRIASALSQFLRAMVSFDSRYDEGLQMTGDARAKFPNFSEQENLGKTQFFERGRCAECHLPNLSPIGISGDQYAFFQLLSPTVNGVDQDGAVDDLGVGAVTEQMKDLGRFKVSSLRNIELTSPYMHDGRFHTLDQVIEHYNWSVKPHANLDPRLRDFAANGMALPEVEKVALAVFLRTLTDNHFISDPKFSDPFIDHEKSERKE